MATPGFSAESAIYRQPGPYRGDGAVPSPAPGVSPAYSVKDYEEDMELAVDRLRREVGWTGRAAGAGSQPFRCCCPDARWGGTECVYASCGPCRSCLCDCSAGFPLIRCSPL